VGGLELCVVGLGSRLRGNDEVSGNSEVNGDDGKKGGNKRGLFHAKQKSSDFRRRIFVSLRNEVLRCRSYQRRQDEG